jgi:CIC family chloride channel protein
MAGLMSGIMHAPLTGIFLIAELTGGYDLFVPIMIVSVVAYLTIIVFEPHSIYTMRLAKKGELITHNKDRAILTLLNVNTLIENDYRIVRKDMNLRQFSTIISESRRNLFPVVDEEGHLEGVVALDDVRKYIFRPELYHKYKVVHFMRKSKTVLRVTDSMRTVTRKFEETGSWNLPVVNENDMYMGFISRSGLFNRYRQTLVDFSAD